MIILKVLFNLKTNNPDYLPFLAVFIFFVQSRLFLCILNKSTRLQVVCAIDRPGDVRCMMGNGLAGDCSVAVGQNQLAV